MVRKGIGSDSRIGYSYIYPSLGYGGSCLPKDIKAIIKFSNDRGYNPKIIESVNAVNDNQKKYFLKKILNKFPENMIKKEQFAIWGLSFKPETDDMREAPSVYFIENIIKFGGTVSVYDPVAMENAKNHYFKNINNIKYGKTKMDILDDCDALILITEWLEFRSPDFKEIKSKLKTPILFDARNQFNQNDMAKRGIEYHQIGVQSIKK